MRMKIEINEKFEKYRDFLERIPFEFDNLGELIYSKRNVLRVVQMGDFRVVINEFRKIYLPNRIIYTYFRRSKGERAYRNSVKLISRGIHSPEPVAFINFYKGKLMHPSYYICLETDYRPVKEAYSLPFEESSRIVKAFADFTAEVQQKGVFHEDFNDFNILYARKGTSYDFSMIDTNRMTFCPYSYTRAMNNIRRLNMPTEVLGLFAGEYAKHTDLSGPKMLNMMVSTRLKHLERAEIRKRIKSVKKIFG